MSVGALIAILVVVVILAVVVALARRMAVRRSTERRNLGPEYNRLVDEVGTRNANAEYDKRRRRVSGLGIKRLSPERRTSYSTQWEAAQEAFIDRPTEAVRTAATLVTAVAADRGYEVDDSDQLLVDLSVYYGYQLDGYRSALVVTEGIDDTTATEKLRQALLHHRAMFRELAEISDSDEMTMAATIQGGAAPATSAPTAQQQTVPPPRTTEDPAREDAAR